MGTKPNSQCYLIILLLGEKNFTVELGRGEHQRIVECDSISSYDSHLSINAIEIYKIINQNRVSLLVNSV